MEENNNSFIHDTINLDEIRSLLEGSGAPPAPAEPEPVSRPLPEKQEATLDELEPQKKKEEKEPKSIAFELYSMLHDLVYILAIVTLLFVFVVRLVGVDGTSMMPTLHHGDYLILESNFLYDADDIENGDIVVLNVPYYWERDRSLIVKRVIAMEGQTVDIDFETGDVYVDGKLLDEPYLTEKSFGDCNLDLPYQVPDNRYFCMGDHRSTSVDSRHTEVGCVSEEQIVGKIVFRVWPLSDFGALD